MDENTREDFLKIKSGRERAFKGPLPPTFYAGSALVGILLLIVVLVGILVLLPILVSLLHAYASFPVFCYGG